MRLFAYLTMALIAGPLYAGGGHEHEPIGEAVQDLPLFDAHMHYKEPAWEDFPESTVIELMDRSGVAMALVSSTPDEGTIRLWEYAPRRIVPEVRPYYGDVNSGTWMRAEGIEGYIEERLEAYPHEGIGEFHIHRFDQHDEPLFREIIAMAKARDIPLHVHSTASAISWLYSLDDEVTIIWAHVGLSTPAEDVYKVMSLFPTVWADTSLRENVILAPGNQLNPKWERIIMEFQDRLMIGSDTWVNTQWENYEEIIASNRRWLALLPRDVAEKIAYKNAERLFGRDVSRELIGER